jgi:hypothetical protein
MSSCQDILGELIPYARSFHERQAPAVINATLQRVSSLLIMASFPPPRKSLAVIVLPVGLFLHPGLVDGYLVPMLVQAGVPGLEK